MVRGIGCDIIEIGRIEASIERHPEKFLDTIFTKSEQAYCEKFNKPAPHYAARFAAKEAVVKALGTGFRLGITWLDIEILNDPKGKPFVQVSPKLMEQFDNPSFLISLSHSRDYAIAFVQWL